MAAPVRRYLQRSKALMDQEKQWRTRHPCKDIIEERPINEPQRNIMRRDVVSFLLGRRAPFLSMNKALPALGWSFALMPSALDIA
jgi:hypothetical protein